VHLHADLAMLFSGAHEIRITALPVATEPAAALPLADNIAGLFRVDHLHNEPRDPAVRQ
jgi:hypothetical protein